MKTAAFSTALLLGCLLQAAPSACASPTGENSLLWSRASESYRTGDFEKARDLFIELVRETPGDSALLYNLGNAHFRLGETGRALLWYERALRENPLDADLRYNLRLARSRTAEEGEPLLKRLLLTPRPAWLLWAQMGLLWFWVLGSVMRWEKERWVAGLMLWAFVAAWCGWRFWEERRPWAIVVEPQAQLRSGPGLGFPVGATVPEGLKVLVLEERDGWRLAGLPRQGLKGWTRSESVERVASPPPARPAGT